MLNRPITRPTRKPIAAWPRSGLRARWVATQRKTVGKDAALQAFAKRRFRVSRWGALVALSIGLKVPKSMLLRANDAIR